MNGQWFCGVDGQQFGPFTWEQMRGMAAEGRLVAESFVRREVDQQWFTAAQIPGLLGTGKAPAKPGKAAASRPQPARATGSTTPVAAPVAVGPVAVSPVAVGPVAVGPVAVGPVAVGQGMAVAPVGVVAANPANFSFSAASPASSATGDDARPAKKSNSNLLLVGGLGGLCAAVAIVGIGIAVWKLSGSPDEVADETGDSQTELVVASGATDVNPVDIDPMDTNPVAEANPAPAAAPKSGGEARPAAPASGPAAGEKVLAAQTKWSNILKVTGITLNSVKLSITSAWLASDAAGTRVNPVVPGAAPAAAPAASAAPGSSGEGSALEPATADTASSEPAPAENATDAPLTSSTPEPAALPAKYVFVEVKITNGSPVPKKYASWNGRSADEVVLADQANRVLAFVPPAATPGVQRQGVVQLAPGQTITDVLVFAAPEQPVEMLKLALVKTALADAAKGQHWGFEIPLEALFPKPVEAAKPAAPVFAEGPRPPASTNGGQPGSISELNATIKGPDRSPDALPPVTAPSPAAPMPDPNAPKKPPSIEELNKQFEELSKPAGGAAANPPAPPKPTPEK